MPVLLWAIGSAIVGEVVIFGAKKAYVSMEETNALEPIVEEVEFWDEEDEAEYQAEMNKRIMLNVAMAVGAIWCIKNIIIRVAI